MTAGATGVRTIPCLAILRGMRALVREAKENYDQFAAPGPCDGDRYTQGLIDLDATLYQVHTLFDHLTALPSAPSRASGEKPLMSRCNPGETRLQRKGGVVMGGILGTPPRRGLTFLARNPGSAR